MNFQLIYVLCGVIFWCTTCVSLLPLGDATSARGQHCIDERTGGGKRCKNTCGGVTKLPAVTELQGELLGRQQLLEMLFYTKESLREVSYHLAVLRRIHKVDRPTGGVKARTPIRKTFGKLRKMLRPYKSRGELSAAQMRCAYKDIQYALFIVDVTFDNIKEMERKVRKTYVADRQYGEKLALVSASIDHLGCNVQRLSLVAHVSAGCDPHSGRGHGCPADDRPPIYAEDLALHSDQLLLLNKVIELIYKDSAKVLGAVLKVLENIECQMKVVEE